MNDRDPGDVLIADQVKLIQQILLSRGWKPVNAVGELLDPTGKVWFTATFTHGEYTVETSYRPKGSGKPEGVTRVRITPAAVQAHPRVGRELGQDLADYAEAGHKDLGKKWPPELWKTLTRD